MNGKTIHKCKFGLAVNALALSGAFYLVVLALEKSIDYGKEKEGILSDIENLKAKTLDYSKEKKSVRDDIEKLKEEIDDAYDICSSIQKTTLDTVVKLDSDTAKNRDDIESLRKSIEELKAYNIKSDKVANDLYLAYKDNEETETLMVLSSTDNKTK